MRRRRYNPNIRRAGGIIDAIDLLRQQPTFSLRELSIISADPLPSLYRAASLGQIDASVGAAGRLEVSSEAAIAYLNVLPALRRRLQRQHARQAAPPTPPATDRIAAA